MAVYKDGDKWRAIYRYTNYKGERKQMQKRGFAAKREALGWGKEVMLKNDSKLDMTFLLRNKDDIFGILHDKSGQI